MTNPKSSKQKVVFLNSVFPCLSETFIYDQMMILQNNGYDIDIVSNNHPEETEVHPRMRHIRDEVNYLSDTSAVSALLFAIKAFFRFPIKFIRSLFALFFAGGDLAENLRHFVGAVALIDKYAGKGRVHFHVNFTYGAAGVAMWLSRFSSHRYTISLHGSDLLFDDPPFLKEKLSCASGVVSISHYNIAYMDREMPYLSGIPKRVIPLGVQSMDAPQRAAGPISTPIRLLNVGRLSIHKAQHLLIEACSRLVAEGYQVDCVIVGEGPKREPLEAQISELDASGYVTLAGPKYHHEVLDLLGEFDLFVMSSITEGMPVAIMEAMRARIPVIAPAISGIPELLDQGEAGILYESNSVDALVEALKKVLNGQVDYQEVSDNAFDYLAENFDFNKNSHRLMEYLSEF